MTRTTATSPRSDDRQDDASTGEPAVAPRVSSYRADIQGLRALASVLVAVYHTWIGTVSGGVDVFFVVTGLLISTTLLGNVRRTGGVDAGRYLTRLAGRLFPLAGLVLAVVTVAVIAVFPPFQWASLFADVFASATYWQNWHLAFEATDYLAMDTSKSPLQHFWAMSVQGQFYVIWAAVVALAVWLARRRAGTVNDAAVERTFLLLVAVVSVASAAWAVVSVWNNPVFAYYDTFARLWEFGIGAAIAVLMRGRVLGPRLRAALGIFGLGLLLTAGLAPTAWHYPGPVALWPALGAAALLLSHEPGAERPGPVTRLLGSKPMEWLGGYSYGLYLWSWPLLVGYYLVFPEADHVDALGGIVILVAAVLLAWASIRGLDALQRWFASRTTAGAGRLRVPLAAVLVPITALTGLGVPLVRDAIVHTRNSENGGLAAAPFLSIDELHADLRTSLAATRLPELYPEFGMGGRATEWVDEGCASVDAGNLDACRFDDGPQAAGVVAVIGDAQAISWVPGLRAALGGRAAVQALGRENCPWSAAEVENEWEGIDAYAACLDHNDRVLRTIEEQRPSLVVLSFGVWHGSRVIGAQSSYEGMEQLALGARPFLTRLAEIGVPVVWLDSPPSVVDVISCAQARTAVQYERFCNAPVQFEQLVRIQYLQAIADETGVPYVSTLDWFCDTETLRCPAHVRGMAVTADGGHLSWGMAQALAPILSQTLGLDALPAGPRE